MEAEDKKGNTILNEGIENIVKREKMRETDVDLLLREIEVLKKRLDKYEKTGEWPADPEKMKCQFCDFSSVCKFAYKEEDLF
jgi:CRISPR/Cas system-associated exonuclease Cas4 (RecB family)